MSALYPPLTRRVLPLHNHAELAPEFDEQSLDPSRGLGLINFFVEEPFPLPKTGFSPVYDLDLVTTFCKGTILAPVTGTLDDQLGEKLVIPSAGGNGRCSGRGEHCSVERIL